jgi:ATP-dependent Lon protease
MTGEITLRGRVLPIGGLKEKVLAAYRFGTKSVIIPRDNERDLSEIPDDIKATLTFHLVDNMDEVLDIALVGPLPGATLGERRSAAEAPVLPPDGPVTH